MPLHHQCINPCVAVGKMVAMSKTYGRFPACSEVCMWHNADEVMCSAVRLLLAVQRTCGKFLWSKNFAHLLAKMGPARWDCQADAPFPEMVWSKILDYLLPYGALLDFGEQSRGWLFHGVAALEQHFYQWIPGTDGSTLLGAEAASTGGTWLRAKVGRPRRAHSRSEHDDTIAELWTS
jgi:hypothetical protein